MIGRLILALMLLLFSDVCMADQVNIGPNFDEASKNNPALNPKENEIHNSTPFKCLSGKEYTFLKTEIRPSPKLCITPNN